jgi:hypothetical protein
MSHLDKLRKSIENMSLDELREHVRQMRGDRRVSKEPRREKKATARRSNSAKGKTSKAIDKMTPDQLAALLAELEGDGDASSGDTTS